MKGSGCALFDVLYWNFIWRGWRNPRTTSVRIVGVPVHIQIVSFPNTSQNHYSMNQLLLTLDLHSNLEPLWYQPIILIATAVCKYQQTWKPQEILLVKVVRMDTAMCLNPTLSSILSLTRWSVMSASTSPYFMCLSFLSIRLVVWIPLLCFNLWLLCQIMFCHMFEEHAVH
jgi:hypothetical protein